MVGGTIIGVSTRDGEAHITVTDGRNECSVRCKPIRLDNGRPIRFQLGDDIWWQCGKVYWTPKRGESGTLKTCRYDDDDDVTEGDDIALEKIGYSH